MFTIGQKVSYGGYEGTITEVCTGVMTGMIVVKLARGSTCVSAHEVTAI